VGFGKIISLLQFDLLYPNIRLYAGT